MVKDANLKIEAMGLLWGLGYVVRPEVVLAQPRRKGSRKADQFLDLTDIDVLGYGFTPLLRMESVAVDCGGGTSRSVMERVFWHRGVMETAEINEAICILGREVTEDQRYVADKLRIRLLQAAELPKARKALLGNEDFVDFRSYYETSNRWFTYLGQNDAGLANYLLKENWTREWERIPTQLPAQLKRWNVQLRAEREIHRFALLELGTLLALGVVRMALHLSIIQPSDFRSAATAYVMGGHKRLRLVEALMQRLSDAEVLASHQPSLDPASDQQGPLEIPFLHELLDVAVRLSAKPRAARNVPRYIQAFQLASLNGNVSGYEAFLAEEADPVAVKLAVDVLRYLGVASNTKEDLIPILTAV